MPGVECSEYGTEPCPRGYVAATYATGIRAPYATEGHVGPRVRHAALRLQHSSLAQAPRAGRSATPCVGSRKRRAELPLCRSTAQTVANSSFARVLPTCVPPYSTFVPCPPNVSDEFKVDTSKFSPGPHIGRLAVWDASDGSPLVYEFRFMAPGPPPTASACAFGPKLNARLSRKSSRFGATSVRFTVESSIRAQGLLVMEERHGAFSLLGPARPLGAAYVRASRFGPLRP